MTERPILFSAPMVRAIIEGTKTQTRRVVKLRHGADVVVTNGRVWKPARVDYAGYVDCPYGQPGDRLWVRETFAIVPRTAYRCSAGVQQVLRPDDDQDAAIFREGWTRSRGGFSWRSSIHMPRWASRILLEVVSVRVERLNDISERDCWAEGCEGSDDDVTGGISGYNEYAALWESINGAGSWNSNPWVWVIEFRRIEA